METTTTEATELREGDTIVDTLSDDYGIALPAVVESACNVEGTTELLVSGQAYGAGALTVSEADWFAIERGTL